MNEPSQVQRHSCRSPPCGEPSHLYRARHDRHSLVLGRPLVETSFGPVVLNNQNEPVMDLDENGFIISKREGLDIISPHGPAEISQGELSEDFLNQLDLAVDRQEFLNWIYNELENRFVDDKYLPSHLPLGWRCRDSMSTPVTTPPPVISWEDVAP
jgi:hypothetical protein